jgi:putative ABC transport system permease protein
VKHAGLSWDYLPEIFVPYEQIAEGPTASFLGATLAVVMRVPHALAPTERLLREPVSALDRTLPLIDVATGSQLVERSAKGARFRAWVIADIATLALVLSALGLYGVLARNVEQRRREFGVRMALGATARTLFGRVCGAGVALAAVGVAIGLAAVCAGARSLRALLFGVTALEPPVLASVALLMLVVAVIASVGPAWRTMRLNPTVAIRDE